MSYVTRIEDGDATRLEWGDDESTTVRDETEALTVYEKAVAKGLAEGQAGSFDDVERSIAREIQGRVGIRKDVSDSLIVAWFPAADGQEELAQQLSDLGGGNVAPEDIHLTVLYVGDPDVEEGEWDIDLIAAVVKIFTAKRYWYCEGTVSGTGQFVGPEDQDINLALVDSPDLVWLRQCLKDELGYQCAVPYSASMYVEQHGFVPHVTVSYADKGGEVPKLDEPVEFEIRSLTLASGPQRATYPIESGATTYSEDAAYAPYYAARDAVQKAYCPLHNSFECSHELLWQKAEVDPRKAGRVLSGANLDALQSAHAAIGRVIEAEAARGMSGPAEADAPTEDFEKERRSRILKSIAGGDLPEPDGDSATYLIRKSSDEQRYTLGPLYAPDRKDAHGEYTDADTLQKALWSYVRESADNGRRMNLQHGDLGEISVAEWVETISWPYEHTITVKSADGETHDIEMPAGTVYVGAVWDEDAYELVKSGKLNGWSLGGKAIRVETPDAEVLPQGYK